MNAEFFSALDAIEKEKGIPKSYMKEKITQALIAAYRRDNLGAVSGENVIVHWDEKKKTITMQLQKEVVEEVENPVLQISLEAARETDPKLSLGDVVSFDVKTQDFGRIAAQTAKQVIIQGIREAERGMVFQEFTSKEHEIIPGTVLRAEPRGALVLSLGGGSPDKAEAMLGVNEQIPGEVFREGDRIRVYVAQVRNMQKGPQIVISRTHPGLVKRLFELEVPEIADGIIEIRSISREAGSRTKIAVWSEDSNVDPIGACVGPRGSRVNAVVEEINGEKIDIVKYSDDPVEFVSAALAPSAVVSVEILDEEGKTCRVVVPFDQLSLAIGKEGQNVRLAAKLTGMKIDIKADVG
ncbi:MAG: transcription termination factor NusA [Oscillospiraceae bacterium]|nr:transcription termination factor NusA [Oscillospiraceae bacterium]